MTAFKVTIILQHFPAGSHMHKTVIFIPEDPKVGVGAVIWAKRQSVSFLPFALIWVLFCFVFLSGAKVPELFILLQIGSNKSIYG